MSFSAHGTFDSQNAQAKEAAWCVVALVCVIVFGTCGFLVIEQDWSPWQALFFTLVTITTVGYGDEGISPKGEIFATVLLLVGIATAT